MSEPQTVSDFLVAHLKTWGVKRLFGYSGDGINGILGALDRAGNDPEFFQVRHEETAALMVMLLVLVTVFFWIVRRAIGERMFN